MGWLGSDRETESWQFQSGALISCWWHDRWNKVFSWCHENDIAFSQSLNSSWPSLMNIGSDNGLLPECTKPSHEPMLTYCPDFWCTLSWCKIVGRQCIFSYIDTSGCVLGTIWFERNKIDKSIFMGWESYFWMLLCLSTKLLSIGQISMKFEYRYWIQNLF